MGRIRTRKELFFMAFVILAVSWFFCCAFSASAGAAQEEGFCVTMETRTHQVTVPAVLTFDAQVSGGSGDYRFLWALTWLEESDNPAVEDTQGAKAPDELQDMEMRMFDQGAEAQEELASIEHAEETDLLSGQENGLSGSHQELSVTGTGRLQVMVTVTDLSTGQEAFAVSDEIAAIDSRSWFWDPSSEQDTIDRYYTVLCSCLEEEENPLENEELCEILSGRLKAQNFTDPQIETVLVTLKNAQELYRNLYLFSFYDYTMSGMQGSGSYYSLPPNSVFISSTSSVHSFDETFFHESGHAIHMNRWDLAGHPFRVIRESEGWLPAALQAGHTETETRIIEALTQDVRTLICQRLTQLSSGELSPEQMEIICNALVNGEQEITVPLLWWEEQAHPSVADDEQLLKYYVKVRDSLSAELGSIPYSNASMVCDLYGGLTNNKLSLPYGHPGEYWYTRDGEMNGMQLCEGWAEFFAAQVRSDHYNQTINEQYFPQTVKELSLLAEELLEQYLEAYMPAFSAQADAEAA